MDVLVLGVVGCIFFNKTEKVQNNKWKGMFSFFISNPLISPFFLINIFQNGWGKKATLLFFHSPRWMGISDYF